MTTKTDLMSPIFNRAKMKNHTQILLATAGLIIVAEVLIATARMLVF